MRNRPQARAKKVSTVEGWDNGIHGLKNGPEIILNGECTLSRWPDKRGMTLTIDRHGGEFGITTGQSVTR